MRCLSQRNRGGITGHILRQYPLCRSCSICPLQCLNLFHKLLNQHTLRIRLQHRKKKQQGRGGGGVLPRSKSLYARLEMRSCSAMASCVSDFCCRREYSSLERSSSSSAWYGFIQKTSIVKLTMEILCRNEVRFHEARFILSVQSL